MLSKGDAFRKQDLSDFVVTRGASMGLSHEWHQGGKDEITVIASKIVCSRNHSSNAALLTAWGSLSNTIQVKLTAKRGKCLEEKGTCQKACMTVSNRIGQR